MTSSNHHIADHWPKAAASAAIFRDDKVLIVERGKGSMTGVWSLPGGHIEPGERAIDAASREVAEETGIATHIEGLVDINDVIFHHDDGTLRAHYVLCVYFGHWQSGEPEAATDARDARFVTFEELSQYKLTPGAKTFIQKAKTLIEQAP